MFNPFDDAKQEPMDLLIMKIRISHMSQAAILRGATRYAPEEAKPVVDELIGMLDKFELSLNELEETNKDITNKVKGLLDTVSSKLDKLENSVSKETRHDRS